MMNNIIILMKIIFHNIYYIIIISAVVDLNGRFFGGRQVRAGFYSCESFANLKLLE